MYVEKVQCYSFCNSIAFVFPNISHINDYLEEMAKTIYDYWFVQFEFPDGNGNPYKTSGGALLYNEVLKKEIPFGWTIDTLLLLCEYWNKMDNSQSIC